MTGWTRDELTKIASADELEIASARRDGTLRKPRTIWVVRVGDDLYVRSMYRRTGGWFPAAQARTKATSEPAAMTSVELPQASTLAAGIRFEDDQRMVTLQWLLA
jgi:hypothetical protein